jgi:hypothetical protein
MPSIKTKVKKIKTGKAIKVRPKNSAIPKLFITGATSSVLSTST